MGAGKELAKITQLVGDGSKSQPPANTLTSLLITMLVTSLEGLWSRPPRPWEVWESVYPGR